MYSSKASSCSRNLEYVKDERIRYDVSIILALGKGENGSNIVEHS